MKGKPAKIKDPKQKWYFGRNFFLQLSIPYKIANRNGTLRK